MAVVDAGHRLDAQTEGLEIGEVEGVGLDQKTGPPGGAGDRDVDVVGELTLVALPVGLDLDRVRQRRLDAGADVAQGEAIEVLEGIENADAERIVRGEQGGVDKAEAGGVGPVAVEPQRHLRGGAEAVGQMAVKAVVLDAAVDHGGAVVEPDLAEAPRRAVVVTEVAPRQAELERQVVAAPRQRCARLPALAGAAVARAEMAGETAAEHRAAGDEVEHAADGVGAVEHRRRAAHDLDHLDALDVDQAGDLAEVGLAAGVVHPQAVLQEQHPQAALAADHRPRLVGPDAVDVDARLGAQQLGGVLRQALVQGAAIENGDRSRDLEGIDLAAGGGNGGLGEEGLERRLLVPGAVGFGLGGGFRGRRRCVVRPAGRGARHRERQGEKEKEGGLAFHDEVPMLFSRLAVGARRTARTTRPEMLSR